MTAPPVLVGFTLAALSGALVGFAIGLTVGLIA